MNRKALKTIDKLCKLENVDFWEMKHILMDNAELFNYVLFKGNYKQKPNNKLERELFLRGYKLSTPKNKISKIFI